MSNHHVLHTHTLHLTQRPPTDRRLSTTPGWRRQSHPGGRVNTYESTFFFLVRDTSPTHSLNISQTQQQVVFTVLAGWAVVLSVAKATFGGGKKEEKK